MNSIRKEIHLFKLAFTLFICILFYVIIGEKNYDIILIACYASIFGIQAQTSNIVNYGIERLAGTFIGGIFSMLYIYFYHKLSSSFDVRYLLLTLPILVWFVSMLVGGFQKHSAAVMGVTLTMITMCLLVLKSSQYEYLMERMLATVVGVFASIIVNIIVHIIQKNNSQEER